MNLSHLRARIVAVLAGVALFLALPFLSDLIIGQESGRYLFFCWAAYAASGLLLGLIWPKMSWRLGLWLFAIWPPMLLLMLFLSGDMIRNWSRTTTSLVGDFVILPVACIGSWVGSAIRRRFMRNSSVDDGRAVPS